MAGNPTCGPFGWAGGAGNTGMLSGVAAVGAQSMAQGSLQKLPLKLAVAHSLNDIRLAPMYHSILPVIGQC